MAKKRRQSGEATGTESRLALSMAQVLRQHRQAKKRASEEVIHDLRGAVRRSRTVASTMAALDPNAAWKKMGKAGKRLFDRLGELRDTQVQRIWVEVLDVRGDEVGERLQAHLRGRQRRCHRRARRAIQHFDRKSWRRWSRSLPRRIDQVRIEDAMLARLAVARLGAAQVHHRVPIDGDSSDYHRLRIEVKRFRYFVENFLPERYVAWKEDLKKMQDMLGEAHDFDVLLATLDHLAPSADEGAAKEWRERIMSERGRRFDEYGQISSKPEGSIWKLWREDLLADAGPGE